MWKILIKHLHEKFVLESFIPLTCTRMQFLCFLAKNMAAMIIPDNEYSGHELYKTREVFNTHSFLAVL